MIISSAIDRSGVDEYDLGHYQCSLRSGLQARGGTDMARKDITRLGELASDDDSLRQIGRRLVEQAAANEVGERLG